MVVEERQDKGVLVCGYLDTASTSRTHAFDTVLVRSTDPNRPYEAEMRPYRLGALSTCDIQGAHGVCVRPRSSKTAATDGYLLGLVLEGQGVLEQDGRRAAVTPGNFVLYSGERPFHLDLEGPYRYFVVSLDQGSADLLRQATTTTANPGLSRFPSGRVLTAALVEIVQSASRLGPVTRQEMGEHVTGMLHTLVREAEYPDLGVPDDRAVLLDRVLEHIDQHLADDLSPAAIAAAQHISVRYLHALFHRNGDTVGNHVRRRRLHRIRRDLVEPHLAHLPAYTIAARWGIPDPSHFSRLFRAEFGTSPREFREWRHGAEGAG